MNDNSSLIHHGGETHSVNGNGGGVQATGVATVGHRASGLPEWNLEPPETLLIRRGALQHDRAAGS